MAFRAGEATEENRGSPLIIMLDCSAILVEVIGGPMADDGTRVSSDRSHTHKCMRDCCGSCRAVHHQATNYCVIIIKLNIYYF